MKGYKGFDKDLKCRDFQYEIGKTYETDKAKLCEKGFHFCEAPLDVLNYYPPAVDGKLSRYCAVEADDVSEEKRNDDSKRASKKLTVGAEIGISGLVKAHVEYVKAATTDAIEKGDAEAATAGHKGTAAAGKYGVAAAGKYGAATAGKFGVAAAGKYGAATAGYIGTATAGECGAATAGEYGVATAGHKGTAMAGECGAATAGECGAAMAGYKGTATAGECGAAMAGKYGVATAGYKGTAMAGYKGTATAGECGAATAGEYGVATAGGSAAVGCEGIAVVRGNSCKVKGGTGSVLVIVEENETNYSISAWKVGVVDGKTLKPDTWYMLKNGEFVEVVD